MQEQPVKRTSEVNGCPQALDTHCMHGRLVTPVNACVPDLVPLTGSSVFEIEATFRRSSVRERNCPLHTSCMRHPNPHASTAQGGAC